MTTVATTSSIAPVAMLRIAPSAAKSGEKKESFILTRGRIPTSTAVLP